MIARTAVRSTFFLAALACSISANVAHAQVTLDFEFLSNPSNGNGNFQGFSVTQNGFTVTDTSHVAGLYSNSSNIGFGFNYIGSVSLDNAQSGSVTTLTQNNGSAFTLNSMDIANLTLQSNIPGGVTVIFTGVKQGGGTVTQSFTHGANNSVETVLFGSDFTNVTSVSFAQNAPFNQFDNIVLNTPPRAVPEPGSIALLAGLGMTGARFALRRRKRA